MKRICLLMIVSLIVCSNARAQFDPQKMDSIRRATNEDYQAMLKQLGIESLRPGPSGDPKAPNAANTDESKATTYTSLPDPLVLNNGERVNDAETWWKKRRPEIVEYFDREVYGRLPKVLPGVTWKVLEQKDDTLENIPVISKKLVGHVDNSSCPSIDVNIQMTLTIPANATKPVPVVMEFGFIFPPGFKLPEPPPGTPKEPDWKQLVLSKGWGYAILVPTSYQEDFGAGLTKGIIGLANKGNRRKPDDWGALRAWAWGASRALDYLETDKSVDARHVTIEGLSRYGKAALVTMAYDSRFAIGFIGSSGAGGAKILRRNYGEQIENLCSSSEYHWFAGNFLKYAGPLTVNDLPVDAHELIALCAPRPVFISSGSLEVEGGWVDAKGMFLGGAYASPVYELLGKKGLGTYEFPPIETALIDGEIAFRQHKGGHTVGPNWPTFLMWAEKYIK
ncbi:MAG TPA: acetylxylan esterase [Bacteroidota bacterium]|nr:acetylxylan esterase [Bacteroidota bacterium]